MADTSALLEGIGADDLCRLAAWVSAAAPTGAFAWSHGLEAAVAAGAPADPAGLEAWVADVLAHGAGWSDAVIAGHAAVAAPLDEPLDPLVELARALAPSRERLAETDALGGAFAAMVAQGWGVAVEPAPYPVAFGAAIGRAGLPVAPALGLMLHGTATMLVSAAQRLMPLGQTAGQRVLAGLVPLSTRLGRKAADAPLDAVGGAAFAADIAAMAHETQPTRLFRS